MYEVQYATNITIPEGEVLNIRDNSGNLIWQKCEYNYTPYNTERYGNAIATQVFNVSQGDIVTIYFYLTQSDGLLMDMSNCGGSYIYPHEYAQNVHNAHTFTVTQDGVLVLAGTYSNYQWGFDWPGSVSTRAPYAKYIRIKIN